MKSLTGTRSIAQAERHIAISRALTGFRILVGRFPSDRDGRDKPG